MSGRLTARTLILAVCVLPAFACARQPEPPAASAGAPPSPAAAATPASSRGIVRGAGEGPAAKRISYITNESGSRICLGDGCEWRVYDPGTGSDLLFLRLDKSPTVLFWDPSFQHVYYQIESTVYQADWRAGATPAPALTVPETGTLTWLDSESGRWRYYHLRLGENQQPGARNQDLARVFERSEADGTWSLIASESTRCGCDGCPCTSVVEPYMHKIQAVLPAWFQVWETGPRTEMEGEEWDTRRTAYVHSPSVPRRALKMTYEPSEEDGEVRPPIVYLDRDSGAETEIYAPDNTDLDYSNRCHGDFDFSDQGPFMLIQRSGMCPKVVDMRTGTILFAPAFHSAQAAWVEPLRQ